MSNQSVSDKYRSALAKARFEYPDFNNLPDFEDLPAVDSAVFANPIPSNPEARSLFSFDLARFHRE